MKYEEPPSVPEPKPFENERIEQIKNQFSETAERIKKEKEDKKAERDARFKANQEAGRQNRRPLPPPPDIIPSPDTSTPPPLSVNLDLPLEDEDK
jgi:hypothetical protein